MSIELGTLVTGMGYVNSAYLTGLTAFSAEVGVQLRQGEYAVEVRGLRDAGDVEHLSREVRVRVMNALVHSGFTRPSSQVLVQLCPLEVGKDATAYDLPIALGVLLAMGGSPGLRERLSEWLVVGELSLTGGLRPVRGVLSMAFLAREKGFRGVIVPERNAEEARIVDGIEVRGCRDLNQVIRLLEKDGLSSSDFSDEHAYTFDLTDVSGQQTAKRALEIAAAGGHNLLMIGPPGSGKTMLAKRLVTILPPMTRAQAIRTTQVHSVAGLIDGGGLLMRRPFRAPHHTISDVGLCGTVTPSKQFRPGEAALAHNGVLLLDEVTSFRHSTLDLLVRQQHGAPMPFPQDCIIVGAMPACPCGGCSPARAVSCSSREITLHRDKVQYRLLQEIEVQVRLDVIPYESTSSLPRGETSAAVRKRVTDARARQFARYGSGILNAKLTHNRRCLLSAGLSPDVAEINDRAIALACKSALPHSSAPLLPVARTIADLAGSGDITVEHITEALTFLDDRVPFVEVKG